MLPDGLEWVLEMLGFDWPKADEDKLRECAQVWRDFADQVDELNYQALSAANSVRSANSGDSIDAFGKAFDKFSTGGDGYLADAATASRLIAAAFDAAAVIVITCKIAVIAQIVILAAEIIAAQAAAPFTFGLSELGALGATQATKMIVRRLLKELRDALIEAIMETLKDPIVSAVQAMISDLIAQTVNQGFGAQDGYDLGRTAKTGWEEGKSSAENWKQTFGESLRDGLGSRAGGAARHHADRAAGHGDGGDSGGGHEGGGENGSGADRGGDSGSSGESNSGGSSGTSSSSGSDSGSGSSGSGSSSGSTGSPASSGGGSSGNTSSGSGSSAGTGSSASSGSQGDSGSGGRNDGGSSTAHANDGRDGRSSAPADPFGTRLTSDPAPAPAANHTPAGGDGTPPPSSTHTPSTGADAGSPAHTGTDGRPTPASDGATPSAGDGRGADTGSPAHTGTDSRPTPASDGATPSAGDGRGADAPPAHTGTDSRPTPASDGPAPARHESADGPAHSGDGPSERSAADTTRPGPGPVSGHPTPDSAPAPASSAGTPSAGSPSADTPSHAAPSHTGSPHSGGDAPSHGTPDSRPGPAPAHSTPDSAPAPAHSGDSRPGPAYGPVRGGDDSSATPSHTGDHGTPAYGPVRGGDAPAHASDGGSTRPGGDIPAQHDRSGPAHAPAPEHRTPDSTAAPDSAPGTHSGGAGRTVPAGGIPHVPSSAVPSSGPDHSRPTPSQPSPSDGPHREATVETASTAVADAPPTRTPTAGPDSTVGQPGPAAQNTGGPVPTGPLATGPVPGTGTPGSAAPTGSSTPHRGGPVPGTSGDGPSTTRPATVPGQSTGRPDHTDRPTGLGSRPSTPPQTPGTDTTRPSRPDPRATDPRSETPRTADPRPAPDRPAPDHPASDRSPENHGTENHGPEKPGPENHATENGPDGRADEHTGSDGKHPSDGQDRPEDTDSRPDGDGDGDSGTETPPHERPLSDSRPYDTPGGLARVEEHHQQELERRIPREPDGTPQRHPDPYGDWPGAVNGDGHREPGRDNNCLDVALSSADTYSGNPTAAAARTDDGSPDGEHGGRDRAERQLGAPFRDMGNGDQAFNRLEDTLRREGHGSQAVIVTQDANGRAHAWNVVNHNGKIVYLDNQTGARSDKPLHSGDHGVFAIPLDADRRPIPSDRPADSDHRSADSDHRPSESGTRPGGDSTGTDRRPADPAGKQKHGEDGDGESDDHADGPPKKKAKTEQGEAADHDPDSGSDEGAERRSKGSAEYDQQQGADQKHYDMLPDKTQQNTRTTNEVTQTNTEVAHQFLEGHIDDGTLAGVLDEAAQRAHGNPPQLGFDKNELTHRLPGFADLSRGEQGAVVAAMGRLSLGFHEAHAVGASPERVSDPYVNDDSVDRSHMTARERKKHKDDGAAQSDEISRGVAYHASQDFRTAGPPSGTDAPAPAHLVREHLVADGRFGDRDAVYALAAGPGRGDHRPDFSGKNFAVIEVVDSEGKTRYVVDSSIPANSAERRPEHSEPHLGRWIDRLNERQNTGNYTIASLYTEREPCGNKPGHAGCSRYISERLPGVPIDYGVGYRKGEQTGDGDSAESLGNMTEDAQRDLNRLGTIWARMAQAGQL
nr:toxin glutamine deamidase domain-containing protein [Streptomyces sp. TLI_235]